MAITKTFCTTREAATLLGVSLTTAQNWVESGLLEAWKTDGGHRRISRESVNKLLGDSSARRSVERSWGQLPQAGGQSRFHILVVEDQLSLLRIYQIRLSVWSMSPIVETAQDGIEALVKIGIKCPDLLITDLQMPHLDGFQMVRTLRTMPACESMEIVVVSGVSEEDIAEAGGLPPGVTVFPKPVPFARLEEIAQKIHDRKAIGASGVKAD